MHLHQLRLGHLWNSRVRVGGVRHVWPNTRASRRAHVYDTVRSRSNGRFLRCGSYCASETRHAGDCLQSIAYNRRAWD